MAKRAGSYLGGVIKKRFNKQSTGGATAGPARSSGVLYGGTFTSKNTYRTKRVNRRKLRRIKRETKRWQRQAAKVQDCQLANGFGTINTATYLGHQDWWSLDFLNGNDLREIFNAQIVGTNPQQMRDYRLYLQSYRINFNIVNTGASQLIMDIYTVCPRRDIADDEVVLTTGYSVSNALKTYNGYYNGTGNTAGTDAVVDPHADPAYLTTDPGVSAFQSSRFTRMFKIKGVRRVELPAGQSFTMTLSLKRPMEMTGEKMQNLSYVRRLSESILVRQVGMPDGTNGYPVTTTFCNWDLSSTSKVFLTRGTTVARILTV